MNADNSFRQFEGDALGRKPLPSGTEARKARRTRERAAAKIAQKGAAK